MVEVMVIFLTYLPLAAAGLAFTTASITAWAVLRELRAVKLNFADRAVNDPCLVDTEFHLTAFTSLIALATRR